MRGVASSPDLVFVVAGFGQVTQQLPKFDIDKHGNRLDKPLDPYGQRLSKSDYPTACLPH